MPDEHDWDDHDLIIKLDTKVDILTRKVDDMASSVVVRVDKVELAAAQVSQIVEARAATVSDHEGRIRLLETVQNQNRGVERLVTATISVVAAVGVNILAQIIINSLKR